MEKAKYAIGYIIVAASAIAIIYIASVVVFGSSEKSQSRTEDCYVSGRYDQYEMCEPDRSLDYSEYQAEQYEEYMDTRASEQYDVDTNNIELNRGVY